MVELSTGNLDQDELSINCFCSVCIYILSIMVYSQKLVGALARTLHWTALNSIFTPSCEPSKKLGANMQHKCHKPDRSVTTHEHKIYHNMLPNYLPLYFTRSRLSIAFQMKGDASHVTKLLRMKMVLFLIIVQYL